MTGTDSPGRGWRLAVDVGGTFTDVVLVGPSGDQIISVKKLTTGDSLGGVKEGVVAALERAGLHGGDLSQPVVHATTLVTNALIEDRGARVAFVAAAGFEDVFEIRTEHRYDMYDIQIELAPPPVPRERVFGLPQRTTSDGSVLRTPTDEETDAVADEITACDAEAVAVGFLHSYASPEPERRVGERIAQRTGLPVSTSSDVVALLREYPRFVTAAANAATIPVLGPYLERLQAWLGERGIPAPLLLMLSNGGCVGPAVAARYPIRAIESGPAAGALAGSWFAGRHGHDRLLCFDMGGTTAKACVLDHAEPELRTTFEYARRYRFTAGSGLPLSIPSVELIEIGAGGGSIARRDDFGLLAVGPRSAGAEPGPACYGRGGLDPTVTDADLLLGYLDAEAFAGGDIPLDVDAARTAVARLAGNTAMDVHELASGIHELANQSMAAAAARHATERGVDLRGVPLLAFGGAGPVHACGVAELLETTEVVFPPLASVLSAFGCLVSPVRIDLARTRLELLADLDHGALEAVYADMRSEARAFLSESRLDEADAEFRYGVDARYRGQANEITVWLGTGAAFPGSADQALTAFEERYETMFGSTIPQVPVEVVTWRIAAFGPRHEVPSLIAPTGAQAGPAAVRRACFGLHGDWFDAAVYERSSVAPGTNIEGPAMIQERDTTVVLRPGWQATVTGDLSIVATREGAGADPHGDRKEAIAHGNC